MMPQLVTVKVQRRTGHPIRIWVPVLPVLLILSPLIVVAAGVAAAACLVYRISLTRAFGTGWQILSALPGTRVGLEQGRLALLVSIR